MSYRNRAAKPTTLLWLLVAVINLAVLSGTSLAVTGAAALALVAGGSVVRRGASAVPVRQPLRRGR